VSLLRSRTSAKELLGLLHNTEPDALILSREDARWERLRFGVDPEVNLGDGFRGALVGEAIGDAMGRPNEGVRPSEAQERRIRDYQPWPGWQSGLRGTVTDDTQMTMWLAESILGTSQEPRAVSREGEPVDQKAEDSGQQEPHQRRERPADRLIDPDDLIQRFTRERIRGIGQATREFVHNVKDLGKPWYEAGVPSAGNGTAMRAAPVGLVHLGDPYRIYRDSLLQSVVTHRDSMAIAAAACQAYAVSRAAIAPPGSLASMEGRVALCTDLAVLLDGLERPSYKLREGRGAPSLHDRIGIELPRYLQDGKVPFDDWHNGAYVLESLPCALWCFLASPEAFEQTLFAAVDAGHDADTVAAMACTLSGAYHGYSRLPQRLVEDLEYHDRLIELANGLYDLNRRLQTAP
jgi:ADP-ribosyl-[dinitrogen reductase] hydrolase